jgi:hypothetical protein
MIHGRSQPSVHVPGGRENDPDQNRAGLLECAPSTTYSGLTKPERGALELRTAHPNRINDVRLFPADDVQA